MTSKNACILLCAGLLVATIVLIIGVIALRVEIAAGVEIIVAALALIGVLVRGILAKVASPKKA